MQWRRRLGTWATVAIAAGAIATVGLPSTVSASPDLTREVKIDLYAPDGCPAAGELRARLAARLGDKPLAPSRVVVTIAMTDDASRLALEIDVLAASGAIADTRRLTGKSCDGLITAAALILSIALLPAQDVATTPAPTIAPDGDELSFVRRVVETSAPSEPVVMRVAAVTALDGGTLPDVAPGVGVALGLVNNRVRVELAALYFPKRRAIADANLASGGDLSAFTTSARACIRPGPVALCGGGEWSLLSATGFGTDMTSTETFFLWGLTGGARWELPLGERVVIASGGELIARPQRPEFRVANPDRLVHRPSWLSARVWLYGEVALF